MSEQIDENVVLLPTSGDAAFATLMDTLAPETGGASGAPAAGDAGAGAPADAGGAGSGGGTGATDTPTAGAADPGAGGAADAGAAGTEPAAAGGQGADAGGAGGAGADAGSGGGGSLPAEWTRPSAELIPEISGLTTKIETAVTTAYENQAFEEVQEQHSKYFEALKTHPRLLVGKKVPALDGSDREETLRDADDAKDWQDAVKHTLAAEVRSRAAKMLEDNSDFLTTVHASIELFTANPDLIPGSKDFDRELAEEFTRLATPYELRVEEKLQGYSIPVQPIIDQLRTRLQTERSKVATSPSVAAGAAGSNAAGAPASTPGAPAAAASTSTPEPPQAGIASKAGSGGPGGDDFSSLFGTIGLPDFRI